MLGGRGEKVSKEEPKMLLGMPLLVIVVLSKIVDGIPMMALILRPPLSFKGDVD